MFPAGSGPHSSAAPPAGQSAAQPGSRSELCGPVQTCCGLPQAGCWTLRSVTHLSVRACTDQVSRSRKSVRTHTDSFISAQCQVVLKQLHLNFKLYKHLLINPVSSDFRYLFLSTYCFIITSTLCERVCKNSDISLWPLRTFNQIPGLIVRHLINT